MTRDFEPPPRIGTGVSVPDVLTEAMPEHGQPGLMTETSDRAWTAAAGSRRVLMLLDHVARWRLAQ